MKARIEIVTRVQDNQDGGYSIFGYNDVQDLLDDHPMSGEAADGKLTAEQVNCILGEDDPYENGYIGTEIINVLIQSDGTVILDNRMHIHAGQ